jgi:hypothetical protein
MVRSQDITRDFNGELNLRAHGDLGFGVKQNAAG